MCCCCSTGGCIECVVVAVLVDVLMLLLLQCWWMSSSTWMTSRCGWLAVCVAGGDRFCLRRRPKTSGIASSVSAGHSSGHRVASSVGGQSTPSCEPTPMSPTLPCHQHSHVTNTAMSPTLPCHQHSHVTNTAMSPTLPCHQQSHVTNSLMSPTLQCLGRSFSPACSCPTRLSSPSEPSFCCPVPLLLFDTGFPVS